MAPRIRTYVGLDERFVIRNKGNCPIANALKRSDYDIIAPKVSHATISFSRRSTDCRYEYLTPHRAQIFVDQIDDESKPLPAPFWLVLDDDNLLAVKPRRTGQEPSTATAPASTETASTASTVPAEMSHRIEANRAAGLTGTTGRPRRSTVIRHRIVDE